MKQKTLVLAEFHVQYKLVSKFNNIIITPTKTKREFIAHDMENIG